MKSTYHNKSLGFFLFLLALVVDPARADRLHLGNGESISGQLLGVGDGKVLWSSKMLGELAVDQSNVEQIESGQHYDLRLSGKALSNCWMYVENARQLLHCDQGVQPLADWKLVVAVGEAVNEPPPRLAQKGNITVAAEDASGNNDIEKLNVDARSELRYIESRHTLSLRYQQESVDNASARDMWRSGYQYDQFFTDQWFVTGNASYEEDEFKEIDQRTSAGLGMGYQFLETRYIDLLGKGTLNYVDEQFRFGRDRATPAFLWNLDFAWRFNERGMAFFHRHAMLQAFDSSEDFEITSMTGFKYPINGHFSSTIQLEYDYDNLPAQEAVDKRDQKWSIGLVYDW